MNRRRLYSRHQPTRCNLLAAIVGASALGKSSILFPARALVPAPDGMLDDIPLGTGEGIAELYLSEVTTGTGKDKKTERKQTRHNLFQYCDEGATLRAISERKGSLLTTQLRTTFSCGTLGQANASKDRTRVVRDYCYGGVFNFTYGAIAELIKGAEGGLPGRFLFAPTIDTTIPRKPVICDEPKVTVDIVGDITFPSEIFDQIQHDIWLRNTGQKETDPLSDHLGWDTQRHTDKAAHVHVRYGRRTARVRRSRNAWICVHPAG
jgi:hypothetical protein